MNGVLSLESGLAPLLLGILLGIFVTGAYAWLNRDLPRTQRWIPAVVRGLLIVIIGVLLARPIYESERVTHTPGRVSILVDESPSMEISDPQIPAGRRLLIARALHDLEVPDGLLVLHSLSIKLQGAAETIEGHDMPEQCLQAIREVAADLSTLDPSLLPEVSPAGRVLVETWQNVPGHELSEMETLPPDRPPDRVDTTPVLQFQRDAGDDFLRRVTGGLTPPADGVYTFSIAADAAARLRVDLDDDGELETVLDVTEKTLPGSPGMTSTPALLEAERVYPFELLHKEATGDDHLTLFWSWNEEPPVIPPETALSLRSDPATPLQRRDALAGEFASGLLRSIDDPGVSPAMVRQVASEWADRLDELFNRQVERVVRSEGNETVRQAIEKVADEARRERAMRVADLLEKAFTGAQIRRSTFATGAEYTDLAVPLESLSSNAEQREVAILITDGRHIPAPMPDAGSSSPSPENAARRLVENGTLLFGVGVGSRRPSRDVSVGGIAVADILHIRDRLSGNVVVRDNMPAGLPMTVSLTDQAGERLWSQEAQTTGEGDRRFAFDLPASDLARLAGSPPVAEGERTQDQAILLRASVDPVEGEARPDNNAAEAAVRLTAGSGRVLVIDGRPRWETRILVSMLERDSRWNVSTFYTDAASAARVLPSDAQGWQTYDLVVIGDVPIDAWPDESLSQVRTFVTEHGGGLILLDGLRGNLAAYTQSPLADVLPALRQREAPVAVTALQPGNGRSSAAEATGELRPESWTHRLPPRWLMPVTVDSPAATVVAEAITTDGRALPAVVTARVGRGRAWYQAFDETWRWRRGDEVPAQQRYWNAIATTVMRQPWFAEDESHAIDIDTLSVPLRGSAGVRVRVKEPGVRAESVQVQLRRVGGSPAAQAPEGDVATLELSQVAEEPGDYAGVFVAPAEPGLYELTIKDGTDSVALKASLFVRSPASIGEFARLEADPEFLAAVTASGGGASFPEEEFRRLQDAVGEMSQTRRRAVTYQVWSGWPPFLLIVALLATEWVVRRRSGLA